MTVRPLYCSVLLSALLVGMSGCSDDPTPVGARILPKGDRPVVQRDTAPPVSHTSYYQLVTNKSTERILLGRSGGYEAWAMIEFPTLPDTLSTAIISNAHIELRTMYHFGDSLAPLSLTMYRASQPWEGDSLTVDSLTSRASEYYNVASAVSASIGSFADTTLISIPLTDTSMVRQWLQSTADTSYKNWGLILQPTNSSVIRGFVASTSTRTADLPALVVDYLKDGASGTFRTQVAITRFKAAVPPATVLTDTSFIIVQEGITYRANVTMDISPLPRGAVINQAYFEVWLEPTRSIRTGSVSDSLYAAYVDATGLISATKFHGSLAATDSVFRRYYQFDVRDIVQAWLANPAVPRRIALLGYNETDAMNRYFLYGTGASAGLRPRIRITYSSTPR